MKPFNLEAALAGAKVVTRDGREVTQLVLFEADHSQLLRGVVNRVIVPFYTNGQYNITGYDFNDLFMAPTKQKVYLRIRKSDLPNVGKELIIGCISNEPAYSENDMDFEVELEI